MAVHKTGSIKYTVSLYLRTNLLSENIKSATPHLDVTEDPTYYCDQWLSCCPLHIFLNFAMGL